MTVEPPASFLHKVCNDQAPSVEHSIAMDMEPPFTESPKSTREEDEPSVPENSRLRKGEHAHLLKEKLREAEILERYLKAENLKLKDRIYELRVQKKSIKHRGVFYYRKGYWWYHEASQLALRVRLLKQDIDRLKGRSAASSQLHLLAEIAQRV